MMCCFAFRGRLRWALCLADIATVADECKCYVASTTAESSGDLTAGMHCQVT
jgi:hypothetical protein